jgi:DNA mismatch repair protein MutS
MTTLADLVRLLESAIVDDPPLAVKEGGIIKPHYHQELDNFGDQYRKGWILQLGGGTEKDESLP